MCGIVGIVNPRSSVGDTRQILRRMTAAIAHRGPDDEGFYISEAIGLGMRRLSIIDLAGGKQPIYNEDRSVVVVFNGEIYNYRALSAQLTKRGHQLKTASDTEVIVHLYEDLGEKCLGVLRGMFAFAIWDERRQRLFLARDRLGIKPLYYTRVGTCVIFASEIKAILQHPEVQAHPDLEALNNFLTLKYVPAPQTMFAGIRALPPAHSLLCEAEQVTMHAYWDVSFAPSHVGQVHEEEYLQQLDALLSESVRLRLQSDVPFGAFLSGGVDSSLVVAMMAQHLSKPVKTFSVGYDGDGTSFSELPYARLVAERYQTDHHEVLVSAQDFINFAEKVVWHLDQPIADQAALATYMVAELASQHVKMVLTGEGGDELFAGYARYAGERFAALFRYVPEPAKALALLLSARIPGLRRPKLALYALCQADEITRLINWFPLFNHDMKAALLTDGMQYELPHASAHDVFTHHLTHTDARDPLSRMLYLDTKLWLPDDLLAREDKMTMAASIEGRVPLLDHKLVEFAASLPPHLKLKRLKRKYLLKQLSRTYLPRQVVDRKKAGFPMPVSVWFRQEARTFVRDLLAPDVVRRRGLFKADYVEKLLDQHESHRADHGSLLWALLNVELWYRLFIDAHVDCTDVCGVPENR